MFNLLLVLFAVVIIIIVTIVITEAPPFSVRPVNWDFFLSRTPDSARIDITQIPLTKGEYCIPLEFLHGFLTPHSL